MIFLDECGVDKGSVENNNFFVVAVSELEDYRKENLLIRKIIEHKTERLKWQKLTKIEKLLFSNYAINTSYNIKAIYKDKRIAESGDYLDIMKSFCQDRFFNKKVIKYHGIHLNSTFQKVKIFLKSKNIILNFEQAKNDEDYGIQIADLWAGYINHSIKNGIDLKNIKNLELKRY